MAQKVGESPSQMSVLFDLWLVNHLISGALDDVLADAGGLSGEDFGFYSLLRRFGPTTPTQIVRWTAMRPTTVSTLVRRLQQHVRDGALLPDDLGIYVAHRVEGVTQFSEAPVDAGGEIRDWPAGVRHGGPDAS